MTRQQLIYDILTILTKANYTDDNNVTEEYIGYKIDEKRAKEIHDSYKRNHKIDPKLIQDFGVTDMTEINYADDKVFGYLDCKMMKLTLPPVVYINNNMSGENNMGVNAIRSVDNKREFYYMPFSKLMDIFRLDPSHPNRKFKYYSQIGNAIYIPDGPDKIHPYLILENPLDGFVRETENIVSGSLVVGTNYVVMDKQIIHNGIPYVKDQTFTAANTTFTGDGHIQLVNQKRAMTSEDNYPMSTTMAELIVLKILTQEFKLEAERIADIRNDSRDSLHLMQSAQQ